MDIWNIILNNALSVITGALVMYIIQAPGRVQKKQNDLQKCIRELADAVEKIDSQVRMHEKAIEESRKERQVFMKIFLEVLEGLKHPEDVESFEKAQDILKDHISEK